MKTHNLFFMTLRPNKKNVFWVTSLKILRSLGTHFFLQKKKYNFMHFECISPFKMHKIIFFPENLKKILGCTSKLR